MLRVALWASGSASGNSTVRFERLVDERSQDSLRHGPEIRLPLRDALWVRNQVVQFSFHVLRFAKHAWGFLMSCPCNSMAHFNFSACLTMRRRHGKHGPLQSFGVSLVRRPSAFERQGCLFLDRYWVHPANRGDAMVLVPCPPSAAVATLTSLSLLQSLVAHLHRSGLQQAVDAHFVAATFGLSIVLPFCGSDLDSVRSRRPPAASPAPAPPARSSRSSSPPPRES